MRRGAGRRAAPGSGRGRAAWAVGLAAAAFALAVALVPRDPVGPRAAPAARAQSAAPAARDPGESLDLPTASRRAFELMRDGRWAESLPYFRRVVSLPGATWLARRDYGTVLHNAAVETRRRRGLLMTVTRSSFERVAMLREALAQHELALELAVSPSDRAEILAARAHNLNAWGFPWDALADYRAAAALDPKWRDHAAYYESVVREPATRFR